MAGITVEWDYSKLAQTYANRPDYSPGGIDALIAICKAGAGERGCDIGAGSGHLTLPLLQRGLVVDAVEPNAEMRQVGMSRTASQPHVQWFEGTGEKTGRETGAYGLVTFGSSFNVVDRPAALLEAKRLLRPGGWFACMWNHRDLDDPLQAEVEGLIRSSIKSYDYGARREDQAPVIRASGLFGKPYVIEAPVVHMTKASVWVDAWRSHATLARQAGDQFSSIVDKIEQIVARYGSDKIAVPYTTRMWITQRVD